MAARADEMRAILDRAGKKPAAGPRRGGPTALSAALADRHMGRDGRAWSRTLSASIPDCALFTDRDVGG